MSPFAHELEATQAGSTIELLCFDDAHQTPEILQLTVQHVIRDMGRLILQGKTDRMSQVHETPATANCVLSTNATLSPAGEIFLNPIIQPEAE